MFKFGEIGRARQALVIIVTLVSTPNLLSNSKHKGLTKESEDLTMSRTMESVNVVNSVRDLDNCSSVICFNGKRENIVDNDGKIRAEKEASVMREKNKMVVIDALTKAYVYSSREVQGDAIVGNAWARMKNSIEKLDKANNAGGCLTEWCYNYLVRYDKAFRLGQWN